MKKLFLIVSLLFISLSHASLWNVTNQWNWEWEKRYSDWFEVAFSKDNLDFFERHNMATDCADVAIAARWIFARMHGLPVLQHSATMRLEDGTREMYSQDTMKQLWINRGLRARPSKPWYQDELFVTALNYVLDNTNTYSLSWDSYPVEISKSSMLIGTHHLTFYPNGAHANILYNAEYFNKAHGGKTHKTIAINMVNSTLPKAVRKLYLGHYSRGQRPTKRGNEGFLRMRWPKLNGWGEYELREREEHPYWSEEQYEQSFLTGYGTFYQAVAARIWGHTEFNYADLELLIKFINVELGKRKQVVIQGYNLCVDDPYISSDDDKIEDCSPGTANYDKYSTPNFDDRLQSLLTAATRTFNMYINDRKYKRRIESFLAGVVKLSGSERHNYHQVDFAHILRVFTMDYDMDVSERRDTDFLFSSDPRDDFYLRWGIR